MRKTKTARRLPKNSIQTVRPVNVLGEMRSVTITITNTDNDAIFEGGVAELERAVEAVISDLRKGVERTKVLDLNGNSIGTVEVA